MTSKSNCTKQRKRPKTSELGVATPIRTV